MKYLLMLFIPIISFSQAPKDANTIIVHGLSINEISTALLDSGYAIEKMDKELLTIRTEPIRYKKYWNGAYKMNIRIKDSIAYFTGIYQCPYETQMTSLVLGVNIQPGQWDDKNRIVYQTNSKGKPLYKSMLCHPFLLMNEFVKSFGKDLIYSKQ